MLVGQGLVVVGVNPHIARARVGLGARRVVRAEAAAVGAPAVLVLYGSQVADAGRARW